MRSYDASVSESNDAILKCTVNNDLYDIVAWLTDDEDIFLPFDQHTNCKYSAISSHIHSVNTE